MRCGAAARTVGSSSRSAGLTPGRALDVGCGEGADAIWLARNGWTVTAIDISEVAVGRARAAAELAGAAVEWICGDALQMAFPAGSFDLVSMQYPALPKAAGEVAVRALLDTVRPGGLLLAVYHDLDDEHREHMKSRGVDPADYVDADDLAPAARRRLHGRATCGRAAHRPAAGHPAHRRRRPARPAPLTGLLGPCRRPLLRGGDEGAKQGEILADFGMPLDSDEIRELGVLDCLDRPVVGVSHGAHTRARAGRSPGGDGSPSQLLIR